MHLERHPESSSGGAHRSRCCRGSSSTIVNHTLDEKVHFPSLAMLEPTSKSVAELRSWLEDFSRPRQENSPRMQPCGDHIPELTRHDNGATKVDTEIRATAKRLPPSQLVRPSCMHTSPEKLADDPEAWRSGDFQVVSVGKLVEPPEPCPKYETFLSHDASEDSMPDWSTPTPWHPNVMESEERFFIPVQETVQETETATDESVGDIEEDPENTQSSHNSLRSKLPLLLCRSRKSETAEVDDDFGKSPRADQSPTALDTFAFDFTIEEESSPETNKSDASCMEPSTPRDNTSLVEIFEAELVRDQGDAIENSFFLSSEDSVPAMSHSTSLSSSSLSRSSGSDPASIVSSSSSLSSKGVAKAIHRFGGAARSRGKPSVQDLRGQLERQWAQDRAPVHTKKIKWHCVNGSYKKRVQLVTKKL